MEKILFYDLETTGLDHNIHAIHQLSGFIRINNVIVKKFNLKIRPYETAIIDPEALEISGVSLAQIMAYPTHQEVYKYLSALLAEYVSKFDKTDKLHLCGYNIMGFDNPFLRKLWSLNNDKYFGSFFWGDSIDVMSHASSFLRELRSTMPNFKLKTVAKLLRIEIDESKLHDALYDVELTMQIFDRINLMQKQIK